jgi:DNA primase
MGRRIPEEEIERLKRAVDLVALVEGRGVVLRRHGKDLLGLCPLHDDTQPSLVLSPEKNLWHCLGACQSGGSVIDWVMKAEGVSFRHAVEILRERAGGGETAAARPRPLEWSEAASAGGAGLLAEVLGYYHEKLKASPNALAYLEKRGIASTELIERFRLGYSDGTLGYRIPPKRLKAGAELRGRLQAVGLYRETTGREHFNGCLVVPVLDAAGQVTEIYGRKIRDDLPKRVPVHLYLPGPHRGVWNLEALQGQPEVILCESAIDALTFWAAGYRHVTWSYGVQGFTEDHLSAFRRCGVRRVLIAYDRDEAGEKAAAALVPVLAAAGIGAARVQFPRGLDANAYALQAQPAAKSLGLLIQSAGHLSDAAEPDPLPSLAAPAAPPPAPGAEVRVEAQAEELSLTIADRTYRVRGLARNRTPDVLRITLWLSRGAALHVDSLDLYQARQRAAFVQEAARVLALKPELLTKDLGSVLLTLEEIQAGRRTAEEPQGAEPAMSEAETAAALALLRDPELLGRILADFERCGVVGEETNKLVGYVAAVSRKLERPLAIIVQSTSAAGKTSLMDAVLSFVPPEEKVQYSALTGQSLFYMEGADLKHKVLAVVEEEGAEKASYALKLLQSEGELTIASTGKDPQSGKLVTHEYRVEGPVMIFLTTTAIEIDEELLNRCLVLSVNETRAQTQAIHKIQRERRTLEGLLQRAERDDVLQLHRNAQRLLRPLAVVNPYAPHLTFLDSRTRTRRDHEKYLTLIDAIALLHQHQREVKTIERAGRRIEYIEATLSDIEHANRLADQVLGRSLDELPPQTRRFLEELHAWVSAQPKSEEPRRFTAREVREALSTGVSQTKVHLARLLELEYLSAVRAGSHVLYELLYDGQGSDGRPFLVGLLDVEALKRPYDPRRPALSATRPEPEEPRLGSGRPRAGPRLGGSRSTSEAANSRHGSEIREPEPDGAEISRRRGAA